MYKSGDNFVDELVIPFIVVFIIAFCVSYFALYDEEHKHRRFEHSVKKSSIFSAIIVGLLMLKSALVVMTNKRSSSSPHMLEYSQTVSW